MLPKQENELFYAVALAFVPEVGARTVRNLLARYGDAETIFKTPLKELKSVEGMSELKSKGFRDKAVLEHAEEEIDYAAKHDIRLLPVNSAHYPRRFMHCDDPPVLLHYKGNADLNADKVIAVIGTRRNTDYGGRVCEDLIMGLEGQQGLLVVSGLAAGIDTIAHKASLRHGLPTVGVLGHGLDTIYPTTNKGLAKEMVLHGGLLSEFPSGTPPDKAHFPIRNRVVAGISDITVLVESDIKGGGMITAYVAHSYNREVAAFPGRVYDGKSGGPNHLIKKNIAAMITGADDLLELMNWGKHKGRKAVQKQLLFDLLPEEQQIVDLLQGKDALHSDELLIASGFSSPQLAAVLLQLEMQDVIKSLPGKQYRLN
jgi:DNA processing protein